MVEFETLQLKEIALNGNGFIEVASKVAITEDGPREFISISKGFDRDGSRKFKQILTVPKKVDDELVQALKSVV